MKSIFDEDYFERGVETGKSLYTNYRWMPKRMFKIANAFLKEMSIEKSETIIDYGAAKGFLVKALRRLGYNAFGVDISKYAISHADSEIKKYMFLKTTKKYDVGIVKDVFEHAPNVRELEKMISQIKVLSNRWFVVVPLGDGVEYVLPEYSKDPSHFIKQPKEWWINILEKNRFEVIESKYRVKGMKDNWYNPPKGHPKSNLFLHIRAK